MANTIENAKRAAIQGKNAALLVFAALLVAGITSIVIGMVIILTAMLVSGVRGTYSLRRRRHVEAAPKANADEGDPAA